MLAWYGHLINYFANYRLLIRFVMLCSKNYAKPPLRKNQEGKKKTNEARPHADAGQEL